MMTSPFCPTGNHFLPDRYVEGTCPICGFPKARGDQCDNCTNLMDPFQLIDPKCKIHGTTPVPRETKHFFFRLTAFQERLAKWASEDKEHWRHHVLTFDVAATQYLNFSGEKMSAGRGKGVWLPDLLERFDPDQLRYYGIATMPETKDTDFEWADFAQRNNSELLAVYGNFVHRALTFADKNFNHEVPPAGFLDAVDKAMVRAIEQQWKHVGQNLEYVHLKDAM